MHRRTMGRHFSEGTRRAWLEMAERGWSLADLVRESGVERSVLHRVMYGDRKPSLAVLVGLKKAVGLEAEEFAKSPVRRFVPPGATLTKGAA